VTDMAVKSLTCMIGIDLCGLYCLEVLNGRAEEENWQSF
jgi:hypothetical protein